MKHYQGMTLVEMMISLTIGVFILGGVVMTYLSLKITTKDTLIIGELQESGRLAMDILRKDLEMAVFWGNYFPHTLNAINVSVPVTPGNDCFDNFNNGSFPKVSEHNFKFIYSVTVNSTTMINCVKRAQKNSDIVQIKHLGREEKSDLFGHDNWYYMLSQSNQGTIIAGSGNRLPSSPHVTIWHYIHHVYYISRQYYSVNSVKLSVPVLMRKRLTQKGGMSSESLMEGIENIRFIFGLDTTADAQVNIYKTSDQMTETNWAQADSKILTVQIYLLVRSLEPANNRTKHAVTFILGGDNAATQRRLTFNDNYRRTLMVSTIKLTNSGMQQWQL